MSLIINRQDLICSQNHIGGQWIDATSGAKFVVNNPADLSPITEVANSDARDAKLAADAAADAFVSWRATPAKERARLIRAWNDLILSHQADLGALVSLEQGKPLAEGLGEIVYAASYVQWFAEEATRIRGDVIEAPVSGRRMLAVKEPVGVVAVVTPWNFPAAMIARKIAPALAAGCTVLAKPAEDTPLTSLALLRLAEEAGIPPGVINIVCASRENTPEVVDTWLDDSRVRKISFTGSTPVGKHLARRSADTLKKLSLELGGNAPFIVFDDADIDAAVTGLMNSKFRNGGQTCVCPNRVYVQAGVFDEFTKKLATQVAKLNVGPASESGAQIGPMINAAAIQKIQLHISDAIEKGARILVGGTAVREELGPNYIAPTVLVDVTNDALLCHEETFGPVVAILAFSDEEEVVRLANDTPFGLAGYFYSENTQRIWRVADAMQVGLVGINEGAIASEAAPFGGVKESGYGREGSAHGLDDYMHIKYLCQGNLN